MELHRSIHCAVGSASVGCFLGWLDFAVFDLGSGRSQLVENVMYRSGSWSLSLFANQALCFSFLGVLVFFLWVLLVRVFSGFRLVRWTEGRVLSLVAATLALGTVVLRIWGGSETGIRPVVFVLLAAMVVGGLCSSRVWSGCLRNHGGKSARWRPMAGSIALAVMLFLPIFLPDMYSTVLGIRGSGFRSEGSPPNVLYVVMDTVRADHLSCYGYRKNRTPSIDQLSREGVLFVNAFAPAPWTLPSHASVFTGLFPSQHGAEWMTPHLDESFVTLAERLSEIGFQTVGVTENPFTGRGHGLAQGFVEYHEMWRRPLVVRAARKLARKARLYRDTYEYSGQSIGRFHRWVRNHKGHGEPFFAFINLMAAHLPNYPRAGFHSEHVTSADLRRIEPVNQLPERFYLPQYHLSPRELGIMEDLYDGEISLVDQRIGELMALLDTEGVLKDTIVILTSDHGENFGDHGLIEHQFCLYNSLLHVPLIIRYPDGLAPSRELAPVSTASLFSTIVDMVETGAKEPGTGLRETVLSGMNGESLVISELGDPGNMLRSLIGKDALPGFDFSPFERTMKSVVDGKWKFVWTSDGVHELFNIDVDFHEERSLIAEETVIAGRLAAILGQWEATIVEPDPDGARNTVDAETRDALHALGYD